MLVGGGGEDGGTHMSLSVDTCGDYCYPIFYVNSFHLLCEMNVMQFITLFISHNR